MKKFVLQTIIAFLLPQFAFACGGEGQQYFLGKLYVVTLLSVYITLLIYLAWTKHFVIFGLLGIIFLVSISIFPTC